MELTVARWLESSAYQIQKELINRETNSLKTTRRNEARCRIPAPSEDVIHYEVFKQTKEEKLQAYITKKQHKDELRKHYGSNWKKYLNIPSRQIQSPIKMSF